MELKFQARGSNTAGHGDVSDWRADCLIVAVFQDEEPLDFIPVMADNAPWLGISPGLRDFSGKKFETAMLYGHPELSISRALFIGLGKREKFKPSIMRDAVATAVRQLSRLKISRLAFATECTRIMSESREQALGLLENAVLGALLGIYDFTAYKSAPSEDDAPFKPASFSLLFAEEFVPDPARLAARRAEALAEGIYLARDVTNGPANIVTPQYMADSASELARKYGFKITVHGPDYLREKGMGAFLAVSLGSAIEPRLIILEHAPKGTENDAPIVIVGKGITFDSGGVSLKPSAGMDRMKRDMAGAGTVLGLFKALGEGSINLSSKRVIGIMPCTENMPDGRATRPGDVVKTLSGKTVDITNTDAEGRLILCDCLTLAQEEYKPAVLIDIATLTGACVVALGEQTAGLFSNDDKLAAKLLEAASKNSERLWQLPVWDEDLEALQKGVAGDMNNTGPREGGASFAALFLKQFINEGTCWAHIDIAGPAFQSGPVPTSPGGATGYGLATLFDFVLE